MNMLRRLLFVSLVAPAAFAGGLEMRITPMHSDYVLGEPVDVVLKIKNTSQELVTFIWSYPTLPLTFDNCKDLIPKKAQGGDYLLPELNLSSGKEYECVLYLNRYYRFDRVKLTTLTARALLATPPPKTASYELQCSVDICIKLGLYDAQAAALRISQRWNKKDIQSMRETIEGLRWVNDPCAMDVLVAKATEQPMFVPEIAGVLSNYKKEKRFNKCMELIATDPSGNRAPPGGMDGVDDRSNRDRRVMARALDAVLRVYEADSSLEMLSDDFLKAQISSEDPERRCRVLQFFKKRGVPNCISRADIARMAFDANEDSDVREYAVEVLEILKGVKP